MREIKFRAWHETVNQMIKNPPLEYRNEALYCIAYSDNGRESKIPLMQYTGLKDKNGAEIFEGDIINYGVFALNDTEKYGKRAWLNIPDGVNRDDLSTVRSVHKVDFFIPTLMAIKQAIENNPDVYGVEVIGNIYENPELLEGA